MLLSFLAATALFGAVSLSESFVRLSSNSPATPAIPAKVAHFSSFQIPAAAPFSQKLGIRRSGHFLRAASATGAGNGEADGSANSPFDVAVVGLGVGGHAACLHAKALGLKVASISGGDPGGTCVNRGCIPSKALLAAARRVRVLQDETLLNQMGISVDGRVRLDPRQAGEYALAVASKVRGGLVASLASHKIPVFDGKAFVAAPGRLRLTRTSTSPENLPSEIFARNIILAPGSTPFVPGGVETGDSTNSQIMTSDTAVGLPVVPSYIAIVGAGYIGLEFAEVFSAMGAEVTLIEAGPRMLPGVDADIAAAAERLLLQKEKDRPVKLLTNTLAASVKRVDGGASSEAGFVEIKLKDSVSGEAKGTINADACLIATGRRPTTQGLGLEALGVQFKKGGFVPVDECMRVVRNSPEAGRSSEVIEGLFCVGDANGLLQLAHAASAQAATAVEAIAGRKRVFNSRQIPAACFTNPEIAFVGYTESEARELAKTDGFEVGVATSSFRANSKAVAEGEPHGMLKIVWRKDNGKVLGCHMIGPHAGDLIQQCSNAIATETPVNKLATLVHTHPTLSETVEAAWKHAIGMLSH